jgi:hypothetical protein
MLEINQGYTVMHGQPIIKIKFKVCRFKNFDMALSLTGSTLELLKNTLLILMEEHSTSISPPLYTQIAENLRTSHCQYQVATNYVLRYN